MIIITVEPIGFYILGKLHLGPGAAMFLGYDISFKVMAWFLAIFIATLYPFEYRSPRENSIKMIVRVILLICLLLRKLP